YIANLVHLGDQTSPIGDALPQPETLQLIPIPLAIDGKRVALPIRVHLVPCTIDTDHRGAMQQRESATKTKGKSPGSNRNNSSYFKVLHGADKLNANADAIEKKESDRKSTRL